MKVIFGSVEAKSQSTLSARSNGPGKVLASPGSRPSTNTLSGSHKLVLKNDFHLCAFGSIVETARAKTHTYFIKLSHSEENIAEARAGGMFVVGC